MSSKSTLNSSLGIDIIVEVRRKDRSLVDIVCTHFISHPLFVTRVTYSHFLVPVSWHIPLIRTARVTHQSIIKFIKGIILQSTFSTMMLSLDDIKLANAYLTRLSHLIRLPRTLRFYPVVSRA